MVHTGLFLLGLLVAVQGQTHTSSQSSATSNLTAPGVNVTSISTSIPVATRTITSNGQTFTTTSFSGTTIVSTLAANATMSANGSSATNSSSQPVYTGPVLDTRITPAFGVLGALLILTGLPSAFLGHKNRWTSFFLTGFYSLALICLALILKFGVLPAIHTPNKTLQGLYVLACGVAGVAGGAGCILFWHQAKYFIGGWGGFALALWIQAFRSGGIIRPIGFRWILYIVCGAIGFVLCTIPKLHYHALIIGTSITGASVFMIGVDCFTTAGLKEFYVYNLGFPGLFPKFAGIPFPLSQTMEIELGLLAAVAVMGAAVQLRVFAILKRKLLEISEEQKKMDATAEAKANARFAHVEKDRDAWEREHGTLADQNRAESGLSGIPLMKDIDGHGSPIAESQFTLHEPLGHNRTKSGLSDWAAARKSVSDGESSRPLSRFNQNPGLLPEMNLGLGLDSQLPDAMMDEESKHKDPDLHHKEELLAEIQTIKDFLRGDAASVSSGSQRISTSLRSRTMSGDLALAQVQNEGHRRERVRSMDAGSSLNRIAEGDSIARPTSVPLKNEVQHEWDAYVRERQLFHPPSGVSAPVAPRPVSEAVSEALSRRQQRESAYGLGGPVAYASESVERLKTTRTPPLLTPAATTAVRAPSPTPQRPTRHSRTSSLGAVNVLPPRKPEPVQGGKEVEPRTRTFEELAARHKAKLRELQTPLNQKEKEQAEVTAARARWERSRAKEKEDVGRRQAEREREHERRAKEERDRKKEQPLKGGHAPDSRRLSAEKLATFGSSSKRASGSMAKVQEWQRFQEQTASSGTNSGSRRTPNEHGMMPFPSEQRPSADKRRSRA